MFFFTFVISIAMKSTILLFIGLLLTHICYAQKDARVQLQLGNWSSPDDERGLLGADAPVNSIGLSAEYRIYKNLYGKLTYQRWQTILRYGPLGYWFDDKDPPMRTEPGAIGHIYDRYDYNIIDALASYRFSFKKSDIYAGVGLSNASGIDYVLTEVYTYGPGYDLLVNFEEYKASYWGPSWELGYNYRLSKDKLNLGVSFGGQHYKSDFNLYTLKLNAGYNFNVVRHKIRK